MLCQEAREHLSAYVDRELTAEMSAAIRDHIATCAECRATVDELKSMSDMLSRLPVRPAPRHVASDVQREIERRLIILAPATTTAPAPDRTLPLRRTHHWSRGVAAAASILLATGIGVMAWMDHAKQQNDKNLLVAITPTERAEAATPMAMTDLPTDSPTSSPTDSTKPAAATPGAVRGGGFVVKNKPAADREREDAALRVATCDTKSRDAMKESNGVESRVGDLSGDGGWKRLYEEPSLGLSEFAYPGDKDKTTALGRRMTIEDDLALVVGGKDGSTLSNFKYYDHAKADYGVAANWFTSINDGKWGFLATDESSPTSGLTLILNGDELAFVAPKILDYYHQTPDAARSLTLTKAGAGILSYSGTNAYSGGTGVTTGTLQLKNDAAEFADTWDDLTAYNYSKRLETSGHILKDTDSFKQSVAALDSAKNPMSPSLGLSGGGQLDTADKLATIELAKKNERSVEESLNKALFGQFGKSGPESSRAPMEAQPGAQVRGHGYVITPPAAGGTLVVPPSPTKSGGDTLALNGASVTTGNITEKGATIIANGTVSGLGGGTITTNSSGSMTLTSGDVALGTGALTLSGASGTTYTKLSVTPAAPAPPATGVPPVVVPATKPSGLTPSIPAAEPSAETKVAVGPTPAPTTGYDFGGSGQKAAQPDVAVRNQQETDRRSEILKEIAKKVAEEKGAGERDLVAMADYSLILQATTSAEGDAAVSQLFADNGWKPVTDGETDESPRKDVTSLPSAAPPVAVQAATFNGKYVTVSHDDTGTTLIVVTDRASLSNFANKLAGSGLVTVASGSSREFSQVAEAQKLARGRSPEGGFGSGSKGKGGAGGGGGVSYDPGAISIGGGSRGSGATGSAPGGRVPAKVAPPAATGTLPTDVPEGIAKGPASPKSEAPSELKKPSLDQNAVDRLHDEKAQLLQLFSKEQYQRSAVSQNSEPESDHVLLVIRILAGPADARQGKTTESIPATPPAANIKTKN
jgi:hypothetical protein